MVITNKLLNRFIVLFIVLALALPVFGAVKPAKKKVIHKAKTKIKATVKVKAKAKAKPAPKVITKPATREVVVVKEIKFKDVTAKHPSYAYVKAMVLDYEAMSGYPDNTFKGDKKIARSDLAGILSKSLAYLQRKYRIPLSQNISPSNKPVTRYELVSALGKTLKTVYNKYELSLPSPEAVTLNDVKAKHWAMPDIKLLLHFKILSASVEKKKLVFKGDKPVTRFDIAAAGTRLIQACEAAITSIPQDKMIALQKKYKVYVGPVFPSRVEKAVKITSKPVAFFSGGWGNINESASATNNWLGFNGSASYGNTFDVWKISGNYEVTGKYGFNRINYLVPSGGTIAGGIVNENRYELELNSIYPIVQFYGLSGKLLLGAKYINLNNQTAPTSFTGFNVGVVTALKAFDRNILARAFYSLPLVRATLTSSILGQPTQLFDYEASIDAELLSTPLLIGLSGETMLLSSGFNRYYNMLFVRYFLL